MRDVKTANISLALPVGTQGHEAYAFWSGETFQGQSSYNDTTITVNGLDVPATNIFSWYNSRYDTGQIANMGKIPDSIVKGKTGTLSLTLSGLDNLNAEEGGNPKPGSGHGIGVVVVYTGENVGYNKIVLKLWGEWLYGCGAAFDSTACRSAIMQIGLTDLDNSRTNDNKFAFFFGEGEKNHYDECVDWPQSRMRPAHLWYQAASGWTELKATTGTYHLTCPMPSDLQPGYWWTTRITGRDITTINLSGNTAQLTADSLIREGDRGLEESYTFVGVVAQYPVVPPLTPTPTPTNTPTPTATPTSTPTPTPTNTPTPTSTPTPTPTPTITPTPTPTPPTLCLDLTSTASGPYLEAGQLINLTCIGSSWLNNPITYVEFQVQIDGTWHDLGAVEASLNLSGSYEGTLFDYQVPSTGVYRFECRVCTDSYCTNWGQAQ